MAISITRLKAQARRLEVCRSDDDIEVEVRIADGFRVFLVVERWRTTPVERSKQEYTRLSSSLAPS